MEPCYRRCFRASGPGERMRPMREALSTARPSRLRLAGFLTLAAGGAMLGIGAIRTWGSVGLSAEVAPTGAVAGAIPGIDVGEGKLALAAAAVVLIGILALRLTRSAATRVSRRAR